MINNISWQGYWLSLALLTACYYLIIYFLYYRGDLSQWFAGYNPNNRKGGINANLEVEDDTPPWSTPEESRDVRLFHAALGELDAFFNEAKSRKWTKEELLFALQQILKKYNSLQASEFQDAISKLIISQAENKCSVHLDVEGIGYVWLG